MPPAPHGSIYRENSPWGAPMDVVTSSSNERSAAISGRVKVSLWLKLNPIWWFFNDAEQNLAVFRGSAHWVLRREVQFGPLSQCSAALGDLRGPTHMRRSCLTLQLWCADRVFQTGAL